MLESLPWSQSLHNNRSPSSLRLPCNDLLLRRKSNLDHHNLILQKCLLAPLLRDPRSLESRVMPLHPFKIAMMARRYHLYHTSELNSHHSYDKGMVSITRNLIAAPELHHCRIRSSQITGKLRPLLWHQTHIPLLRDTRNLRHYLHRNKINNIRYPSVQHSSSTLSNANNRPNSISSRCLQTYLLNNILHNTPLTNKPCLQSLLLFKIFSAIPSTSAYQQRFPQVQPLRSRQIQKKSTSYNSCLNLWFLRYIRKSTKTHPL